MIKDRERLIGEKIITERTILRNFRPWDIEDLYEYCSQDNVGEMAGWPKHTSIDYTKKVLNDYMNNKNIYAVVNKENNKVIGHIHIQKDSEDGREDTKELGYVLNKNYWNKGIMTEVVKAVLKELFDSCEYINYVYACCFKENIQSKRLIEKCGFKFQQKGEFESKMLHKTFESYEYVYTREMWNARYTSLII